jgi:hypothetical protein
MTHNNRLDSLAAQAFRWADLCYTLRQVAQTRRSKQKGDKYNDNRMDSIRYHGGTVGNQCVGRASLDR